METSQKTQQEMESQREKLFERKKQLTEKIRSLNFFLANPGKNQKLKELIEEKETLRKIEKEILEKIRLYERFIRDRLIVVEAILLAIANEEKKTEEVKNKIKKKFKTLASKSELCRIVKGKDSMDIIDRYERQDLQVGAAKPSWLIKWQIEAWNAEDEVKKDFLEHDLSNIKIGIKETDNRYRETKRLLLKEEIKKAERELQTINKEIMKWSAEGNNFFASPPVSSPASPHSMFSFRKRKRKNKRDLPVATSCDQNGHQRKKIWKFFVVFSENEQGEELSANENEFSSRLKDILNEVKYRGVVNMQLVHEKLILITKMTPHQRRAMKEVFKGGRFIWWKIDSVGKKHRIFCDINEKNSCIRFTIVPRKEAYYGNH